MDAGEKGLKKDEEKERDRKIERAETSQLSFMLSGRVSGPFVVLFSIPLQTTTGHIKHSGTKSQERAGVCVCVYDGLYFNRACLHTRVCSIPLHFHCAQREYGFMDALLCFCMTCSPATILFQPLVSNLQPIQGKSHTEGRS